MYRRYEPIQKNGNTPPKSEQPRQIKQNNSPNMQSGQGNKNYRSYNNSNVDSKVEDHHSKAPKSKKSTSPHPITKLIPQSLYNPETGKIFGFLSTEDLLIVALIFLLVDSGDSEDGDNSILIYALLYILISEHIDLPI